MTAGPFFAIPFAWGAFFAGVYFHIKYNDTLDRRWKAFEFLAAIVGGLGTALLFSYRTAS